MVTATLTLRVPQQSLTIHISQVQRAHCSTWGKCEAWGPHQMGMHWLMGLAIRWLMEMGSLSRGMDSKWEIDADAEVIPTTSVGYVPECGDTHGATPQGRGPDIASLSTTKGMHMGGGVPVMENGGHGTPPPLSH